MSATSGPRSREQHGTAVGTRLQLCIDLGTSHTVAVLQRADQSPRALLFDGSPVLSCGVFAGADGVLHTGRDAERLAQVEPERFEPHPKRRVDEGSVLLGESELPVAVLLAAVLRRVAQEAATAGADATDGTVLTCPADWGRHRRAVLLDAARLAGFGEVALVDEPVAAATYCMQVLGQQVPVGQALAVFDFGGGTLDVAVLRRAPAGLHVLATGGLADLGGLDVDAALVGHLGQVIAQRDPAMWQRLNHPANPVELRERQALWSEVRSAKEMLSRTSSAPVQLPRTAQALHLTREELDRIAGPLIDRAVDETLRMLQRSTVGRSDLAAVLLVGGSSRIPLVASRLHARLNVTPTVPEQPELPVALGGLLATGVARPSEALRDEWDTLGPPTTARLPQPPLSVPPASVPQPRVPQQALRQQPTPAGYSAAPDPAPAERRRRGRRIALIAVPILVAALIGAGIWLYPTGSGNPNAASAQGVPAGFVACSDVSGAYCLTQPRCWGGINTKAGRLDGLPRDLDCKDPHRWEAFVAGRLPADAVNLSLDKQEQHAAVQQLCSDANLKRRTAPAADTEGWTATLLPFAIGSELFYCVGNGGETTGSVFRTG